MTEVCRVCLFSCDFTEEITEFLDEKLEKLCPEMCEFRDHRKICGACKFQLQDAWLVNTTF